MSRSRARNDGYTRRFVVGSTSGNSHGFDSLSMRPCSVSLHRGGNDPFGLLRPNHPRSGKVRVVLPRLRRAPDQSRREPRTVPLISG